MSGVQRVNRTFWRCSDGVEWSTREDAEKREKFLLLSKLCKGLVNDDAFSELADRLIHCPQIIIVLPTKVRP